MNLAQRWNLQQQALRQAWRQRPERERRLLMTAVVLLLVVGLWQLAVAPAWLVWRQAPVRQAELDARTTQMLALQAQAKQWQASPPVTRSAALQQLQTSAEQWLGAGVQLQVQGDQLLLTLKAAPAEGLAQWLAQARSQSQARPVQAELQRTEARTAGATPTWQGQLTLRLP